MLASIYGIFESLGINHPLHPVMTHIPMGMSIGAFLFAVGAYKWEELSKTANHCAILALLFIPPTVVLGIMDWQYRYRGRMETPIIVKMFLGAALAVLLSLAIYLKRRESADRRVLAGIYALCMMAALALGFFGSELVFG